MEQLWKDPQKSFEERARDLVGRMTLEEKVSQMVYNSSALSRFGIMEHNWWNEALHGVARAGVSTMFPQAIAMAASFNTELMGRVAAAISDEGRAKHHEAARHMDFGIYKNLTFWSPNVNIFRDPRWGRGHETYGEDPYLTSRMGVEFCKGLQGDDEKYLKAVATPKHYAAHSGPEADRHHFDAKVSQKDMYETYLPAFEACVKEAGAFSVMGAYNRTNSEACCASPTLLQKILRDDWGFEGYVVSDCGAIQDIFKEHKLVPTPEEAAALAVKNGCDLNCGFIYPHLVEAVKKGLITEEEVDRAVYRLMLARFKLGEFDDEKSVKYAQIPYEVNDCEKHHELSLEMARESLVLLKNDGMLPLKKNKVKTIAVIGPNADNPDALKGNYFGTPSVYYTVLQGLRKVAPDVRFIYAEGCTLTQPNREASWHEKPTWGFAEALAAAERADAVLLVTGMTAEVEGEEAGVTAEGGDRQDLALPGMQPALVGAIARVGKPTALLNMTGSCVDLREVSGQVNALIQCWYPGQFGGIAIAEAVFGLISPSGRLPVTFYGDLSQLPDFADYSMENRTYKYFKGDVVYPFGFGLSYSDIAYSGLTLSGGTVKAGESLTASFTVKNNGALDASECCQVYITDVEASSRVPRWKLCAFQKVRIPAKKSKKVEITIGPDAMTLVRDDGSRVLEPGAFRLYIGGCQPDSQSRELSGKAPLEAEFRMV